MVDKSYVPVDDESLNLLETALDYHFTSEKDEYGEYKASGEFSMYQLLDFWSGRDPALDEAEETDGGSVGTTYRGGPLLNHKDVIKALIAEVRRLRALDSAALS